MWWVQVPRRMPVFSIRTFGEASAHAWLKPKRIRRDTGSVHHSISAGSQAAKASHKRPFPGAVPGPASILSERSVAVNALGLEPRDRRCKSCRSDHFYSACRAKQQTHPAVNGPVHRPSQVQVLPRGPIFQVSGPDSGAPVCDAGEESATPFHLTTLICDRVARLEVQPPVERKAGSATLRAGSKILLKWWKRIHGGFKPRCPTWHEGANPSLSTRFSRSGDEARSAEMA